MYGKIFKQIYASSIAQSYKVRHIFMDLIVLADSDGVVDMTHDAISGITRVPIEDIRQAISVLEKPDPQSRTPEMDGARLVRLDDHRNWGWQIVNYSVYRAIKDENGRREYQRQYMRKYRETNKKPVRFTESLQVLTSPSTYTSPSGTVSEGGVGETMKLLKEGLNALFDRAPSRNWTHLEESSLFEISKRPGSVEELAELRRYSVSNGKYFAKSIASLLADWDKFLDHAKSHQRDQQQSKPKSIAQREADKMRRELENL